MTESVTDTIMRFHNRIMEDPHHRYRSWEHCFGFFQGRSTFSKEADIDAAALHLGFYLASWGMYRGSTFLLWKDYTVHRPAVRTLLERRFEPLWAARDALDRDGGRTAMILKLSEALRRAYIEAIDRVNGEVRKVHPTDTQITKTILGTIGCAPACDRYFKDGFRNSGLPYSAFDENFLSTLQMFVHHNADALSDAKKAILSKSAVAYPVMKLVDMYFWQRGADLPKNRKALRAGT